MRSKGKSIGWVDNERKTGERRNEMKREQVGVNQKEKQDDMGGVG